MCSMCVHTDFLFEPRVGVGRGEGRVLMMSFCMQMCWWEEFGNSHFFALRRNFQDWIFTALENNLTK